MSHSLLFHSALALTLLGAGPVSAWTSQNAPTTSAFQLVTSLTAACGPRVQECKARIIAQEREKGIDFGSSSRDAEITIQELKKGKQNLPVPGAVNFYEGEASFGRKPKFRKLMKIIHWRPFLSAFDLRGFVGMCCLGLFGLNGTIYELEYEGNEMVFGRLCWVYQAQPKGSTKRRHFEGTIWVLPNSLAIVRDEGAFYPMRKIVWYCLVGDHWFKFDSLRKEISPGNWAPDFTCTGVPVRESDFTNRAFQARIIFLYGSETDPNAAAQHACGMESVQFPAQTTHLTPGTSQILK